MSLQALTVCSTMAPSTCRNHCDNHEPLLMRSSLKWGVIPAPERSSKGFLRFSVRARIDQADGPAWAALKKHRRPRLRRGTSCRGATPDTAGGGFNSGAWGRLKAARPDTVQVNLPLPLHSFNGVGGGFVVNLTNTP